MFFVCLFVVFFYYYSNLQDNCKYSIAVEQNTNGRILLGVLEGLSFYIELLFLLHANCLVSPLF